MNRRRVTCQEHRHVEREKNFCRFRETSEDYKKENVVPIEDRRSKLLKWQADRALQKKLDAKKKKPVFSVGIYRHRFFSPESNEQKKCNCGKNKISRAGLKNVEASVRGSSSNDEAKKKKRARYILEGRAKRKIQETLKIKKDGGKSFVQESFVFKTPKGIKPIPLVDPTTFALNDITKHRQLGIRSFRELNRESNEKSEVLHNNSIMPNKTYNLESWYPSIYPSLVRKFFNCHSSILDIQKIQKESEVAILELNTNSTDVENMSLRNIRKKLSFGKQNSKCDTRNFENHEFFLEEQASKKILPSEKQYLELSDAENENDADISGIRQLPLIDLTCSIPEDNESGNIAVLSNFDNSKESHSRVHSGPETVITSHEIWDSNCRLSFLGEKTTEAVEPFSNGDLILFESVKKLPKKKKN